MPRAAEKREQFAKEQRFNRLHLRWLAYDFQVCTEKRLWKDAIATLNSIFRGTRIEGRKGWLKFVQ